MVFNTFGGDKRDRTVEALNAMAHVVQKSIDKPHISLKNKKYWNYCTQLLDENPIIPMPDILIQVRIQVRIQVCFPAPMCRFCI